MGEFDRKGATKPPDVFCIEVLCAVDHGGQNDGVSQSGIMIKTRAKLNLRCGAQANPENI